MISTVSSVNFKGGTGDVSSLINNPGKFSANAAADSAAAAKVADAPKSDKVELSGAEDKENNHTAAKIGGTIAGLALLWAGLGWAVKSGKIQDVPNPDNWSGKAKHFVYKVGDWAVSAYDATLGKLFNKKAAEAATEAAEEAADKASA